MTETSFTKTYKFSIYALITFFVFYYVQALYYRYFFFYDGGLADWQIYSQALQLIQWNDLNPYLPIRGLRIFNDHFDPIIIPFALTFAKIFPPALVMITIEIFSIAASAWLTYWYGKKRGFSPSATVLMVMYLLFNPGVLQSLWYPSHPTVWSTFPLLCLGIAWMEGKFKWVLASLVFLYTFKEEFPLVGFMVAIIYSYKKQWRHAIITFLVSFAWFWFTQNRSLFFSGYHINYNSGIWTILKNPLSLFNDENMKSSIYLLNLFYVFLLISIPSVYALFSKSFNEKTSFSKDMVFFSLPLFFVRATYRGFMGLMDGRFLLQLTTLWGLALFNSIKKTRFPLYFLLGYGLVLFLMNNFYAENGYKWTMLIKQWRVGLYTSMIKDKIEGRENSVLERKRSLDEAVKYVSRMGDKANIFTKNLLELQFSSLSRYVYMPFWSNWDHLQNISEVFSDRDEPLRPRPENDNYLVLEKKDFDSNNPFIKNFMKGAEVVVDNEYVVIAKKKAQN